MIKTVYYCDTCNPGCNATNSTLLSKEDFAKVNEYLDAIFETETDPRMYKQDFPINYSCGYEEYYVNDDYDYESLPRFPVGWDIDAYGGLVCDICLSVNADKIQQSGAFNIGDELPGLELDTEEEED